MDEKASSSAADAPSGRRPSIGAWMAVFGASLSLFCTVGLLNAFGVFQAYYVDYLQGESESDISWIGSVTIFFIYAGAPPTGVIVDKFGPTVSARLQMNLPIRIMGRPGSHGNAIYRPCCAWAVSGSYLRCS